MEVCYKCHEIIDFKDKYIFARIAIFSNPSKFHIDCYKSARKKNTIIFLLASSILIIGLVLAVIFLLI